jgi:hypothetical protein
MKPAKKFDLIIQISRVKMSPTELKMQPTIHLQSQRVYLIFEVKLFEVKLFMGGV